ncbi:MAG: hypothetical protein Q4A86_05285, partial [Clostridia bacterium]|nr:hypothetical protein [Clostridia bacterium]
MEIELGEDFNEDAIRDAINPVEGVTVSSVQSSGAQKAIVKTTDIPQDKFEAVQDAVSKAFPDSKIISRDSVSATMGKEMWLNAAKAILIAVLLMLVYIGFRFDFWSGLAAICALAH